MHGVNAREVMVLRRSTSVGRFANSTVRMPPCVVAMAACGTVGDVQEPRISDGEAFDQRDVPPFLAPCRKGRVSGKNEAAEAEAICETASRPSMRYALVKTVEQQDVSTLHRFGKAGRGAPASQVPLTIHPTPS
jgi:transposase